VDPCQVVPTDTLVSTLQLSCSAVQWREKRKSQLSVRSSKALNKGLTNDVSLSAVMLTLSPHGGHFLGGTVVQVSGPCLDESDNITCVFDGQETEGVFVSTRVALCLSPPLMMTGGLPFQLVVRSAGGSIRSQGTAEFFSCKHVQNYILPISFILLYAFISAIYSILVTVFCVLLCLHLSSHD